MEYFEGEFDKNIVESKNIIQQIKMERKTKKNNVQNNVINKPDKLKILKTKLKNAKKYLRYYKKETLLIFPNFKEKEQIMIMKAALSSLQNELKWCQLFSFEEKAEDDEEKTDDISRSLLFLQHIEKVQRDDKERLQQAFENAQQMLEIGPEIIETIKDNNNKLERINAKVDLIDNDVERGKKITRVLRIRNTAIGFICCW